jgi:hypothetical protein
VPCDRSLWCCDTVGVPRPHHARIGQRLRQNRFWDVESGAGKGQDTQGTYGEALAGERFAFSKKSSTEQVVGSFIVTAQSDLVRVYEEASEEASGGSEEASGGSEEGSEEGGSEEGSEEEGSVSSSSEEEEEEEEGVEDKNEKWTAVAALVAPSPIASLACAGDKIAVGLENGGVLHLRAAFLAAIDTTTRK